MDNSGLFHVKTNMCRYHQLIIGVALTNEKIQKHLNILKYLFMQSCNIKYW